MAPLSVSPMNRPAPAARDRCAKPNDVTAGGQIGSSVGSIVSLAPSISSGPKTHWSTGGVISNVRVLAATSLAERAHLSSAASKNAQPTAATMAKRRVRFHGVADGSPPQPATHSCHVDKEFGGCPSHLSASPARVAALPSALLTVSSRRTVDDCGGP